MSDNSGLAFFLLLMITTFLGVPLLVAHTYDTQHKDVQAAADERFKGKRWEWEDCERFAGYPYTVCSVRVWLDDTTSKVVLVEGK